MRIVIVGGHWLGASVLRLCLDLGLDVIRALAATETDRLHRAAVAAGVSAGVHAKAVSAADMPASADLIVAAHCHAYVTRDARAASRLGCLAYHPSLLPRHRGRDAIRWAIHMCEAITGGTVYWMDDEADTGPIAAQDWCHVRPDDDARSLWERELGPMGLKLFHKALCGIRAGKIVATAQDDALATWEPAFQIRRLSNSNICN